MAVNSERLARTMIVIGASAGGVEALRTLFSKLPIDLPAAVVTVLHRSPTRVSALEAVLGQRALIRVTEAVDGETIEWGRVYVAPADAHVVIEPGRLRLHHGPKIHFTRPAVDPLFTSAAAAYGSRVVGVLLSGGGDDGVSGLIAIKAAGGLSLVQHPAEAIVSSMPLNAIAFDHVDAILPLALIAATLVTLATGEEVEHPRETEAPPSRGLPLRAVSGR
jgi:two-component system chemotaxis response regulator CheB